MNYFAIAIFIVTSTIGGAYAEPLELNKAPVGSVASRNYIDFENAQTLKHALRKVVGHVAYEGEDGAHTISVVKVAEPEGSSVTLKDVKPIFQSIVDSNWKFHAKVPLFGANVDKDKKFEISVVEVAELTSEDPDWMNLLQKLNQGYSNGLIPKNKKLYFIEKATFLTAHISDYSGDSQDGKILWGLVSIGGNRYYRSQTSGVAYLISVSAKPIKFVELNSLVGLKKEGPRPVMVSVVNQPATLGKVTIQMADGRR